MFRSRWRVKGGEVCLREEREAPCQLGQCILSLATGSIDLVAQTLPQWPLQIPCVLVSFHPLLIKYPG